MKPLLFKLAIATAGIGGTLGVLVPEAFARAMWSDERLKRDVRLAGGLARLRAL
jgi:hypothetical protein